ncbi:MAG: hypothetical protein CMK09_04685 [Ponticaulis sp.]|nr:hypothetical protein [Ponticaulis sp.]|tara:strand:- start:27725 stop:30427 length:2703 start_codon:yes stop_codon:yes gene_type:complete
MQSIDFRKIIISRFQRTGLCAVLAALCVATASAQSGQNPTQPEDYLDLRVHDKPLGSASTLFHLEKGRDNVELAKGPYDAEVGKVQDFTKLLSHMIRLTSAPNQSFAELKDLSDQSVFTPLLPVPDDWFETRASFAGDCARPSWATNLDWKPHIFVNPDILKAQQTSDDDLAYSFSSAAAMGRAIIAGEQCREMQQEWMPSQSADYSNSNRLDVRLLNSVGDVIGLAGYALAQEQSPDPYEILEAFFRLTDEGVVNRESLALLDYAGYHSLNGGLLYPDSQDIHSGSYRFFTNLMTTSPKVFFQHSKGLNVAPALYDGTAIRHWLDQLTRKIYGPDIGPGLVLASENAKAATGSYLNRLEFMPDWLTRDYWQDQLFPLLEVYDREVPGCVPVELSADTPVQTIRIDIRPAASQCLVVSAGEHIPGNPLPPYFSVLAEVTGWSRGTQLEKLGDLHLNFAQNWSDDESEPESAPGLNSSSGEILELQGLMPKGRSGVQRTRAGFITFEQESGRAVKNWQAFFSEDEAFQDGGMTLVFTNADTDTAFETDLVTVEITLVLPLHKAQHDLQLSSAPDDDPTCKRRRTFASKIPRKMDLYPVGGTLFGSPIGDGARPSLLATYQIGGIQSSPQCVALAGDQIAGLNPTDFGLLLGLPINSGGQYRDGSPAAICSREMSQIGSIVRTGTISGIEPTELLEVSIEFLENISGPGRYQAEISVDMSSRELDEGDYQSATTSYTTQTVEVTRMTATYLEVRYSADFPLDIDMCSGTVSGSISGTIIVPYALPDALNTDIHIPPPWEMAGIDRWRRLPAIAQDEARKAWEEDKVMEGARPATASSSGLDSSVLQACPEPEQAWLEYSRIMTQQPVINDEVREMAKVTRQLYGDTEACPMWRMAKQIEADL